MTEELFDKLLNELYLIKVLMDLGFDTQEAAMILEEVMEDKSLSEALCTRFMLRKMYGWDKQPNCS